MSPSVEERLRAELARRAAVTRISPTAREDILYRTRRLAPERAFRRPGRWLRPAVALAAVLALLVVAVRVVDDGADDPGPPLPVVQPLPARPPAVQGTVLGSVITYNCEGCGHGPAELDLATPAEPRLLFQAPFTGTPPPVMREGRLTTDVGPGGWVVDLDGEAPIPLGGAFPQQVDVLPDGRVITFDQLDEEDDHADLRILGPGRVETEVSLPDGFAPFTVTAGPQGWVALAGEDGDCCLASTELVLVAPDRSMRRIDIQDHVEDQRSAMSGYRLSWSSRGLIAFSGAELEPLFDSADDPLDWTLVLDPTTGETVALLDDWQGVAWAPDGTGLLTARRTSNTTADLRLFWGPDLADHTDLGPMDSPFTPYWWAPSAQNTPPGR